MRVCACVFAGVCVCVCVSIYHSVCLCAPEIKHTRRYSKTLYIDHLSRSIPPLNRLTFYIIEIKKALYLLMLRKLNKSILSQNGPPEFIPVCGRLREVPMYMRRCACVCVCLSLLIVSMNDSVFICLSLSVYLFSDCVLVSSYAISSPPNWSVGPSVCPSLSTHLTGVCVCVCTRKLSPPSDSTHYRPGRGDTTHHNTMATEVTRNVLGTNSGVRARRHQWGQ